MPTGRETIINRRLSGSEARQLILADFEALLANEGLLSDHVAYGRIAWEVELKLHVENAMSPDSRSWVESATIGGNLQNAAPQLAAVEAPPLVDPSDDAVIAATQVARAVESPNAERLRTGMPVTLDVKQQDGTTSQQQVTYPVETSEGAASQAVIIDTSAQAHASWKQKMDAHKARKLAEKQAEEKAKAAS